MFVVVSGDDGGITGEAAFKLSFKYIMIFYFCGMRSLKVTTRKWCWKQTF